MGTALLFLQISLGTIGLAVLFYGFKFFFFQKKNTYLSRHAYNVAYNNSKHSPELSPSPTYTFGLASVLKTKQSFVEKIKQILTGQKGLQVSSTIIQSRPLSSN